MAPLSICPVTTVPLPAMEYVFSIGIRKGLSISLTGVGIHSSTASRSFFIELIPSSSFLSCECNVSRVQSVKVDVWSVKTMKVRH